MHLCAHVILVYRLLRSASKIRVEYIGGFSCANRPIKCFAMMIAWPVVAFMCACDSGYVARLKSVQIGVFSVNRKIQCFMCDDDSLVGAFMCVCDDSGYAERV